MRHDGIRVDEDKYVTLCVSRSGVSGSRNGLHRLMDHRRALVLRDGSGLILAIVVDDDHVDVDFGASAQVRRSGLDRIQSRREVGLFIVGGDDDREFHEGQCAKARQLRKVCGVLAMMPAV